MYVSVSLKEGIAKKPHSPALFCNCGTGSFGAFSKVQACSLFLHIPIGFLTYYFKSRNSLITQKMTSVFFFKLSYHTIVLPEFEVHRPNMGISSYH